MVSAFVLSFHSRFHLPALRFQLLFWLLIAASLSSFLSSHLYKYRCKLGGSIEVSLHLCALLFCLMVFFSLSTFVSADFLLWCGWLLRYIYFLNHFCWGVEFVTAGLFNWSTASFGYVHSEFFWGFSRLGKPKNWVRSLCTQRFSLVVYLVATPMCSMISIFDVFVLD